MKKGDRTGSIRSPLNTNGGYRLLNSFELLENRCHFRTIAGAHSNILPLNLAFPIGDKHGWACDLFLWVQHVVRTNEIAIGV